MYVQSKISKSAYHQPYPHYPGYFNRCRSYPPRHKRRRAVRNIRHLSSDDGTAGAPEKKSAALRKNAFAGRHRLGVGIYGLCVADQGAV